MKLIKSKKSSEKEKQLQELFPKVKTFSKAYDFSSQKQETTAGGNGYTAMYHLDERPYAVVPVPAGVPESINASDDPNAPERIDLQDTLLTDESFTDRPSKHHSSEKKDSPVFPDAFKEPDAPEEPEAAELLDLSGIPDHEPDDDDEPFYQPDPEDEYDPEPLYSPVHEKEYEPSDIEQEEDAGIETDLFPESGDDPYQESDSLYEFESVSADPASSPDPETDPLPGHSGESDAIKLKFKKKKYAVAVGKKTNLNKKLKSHPKGSLKWKCSDKKIARVSKKGILTPKRKGKITVRVKAKDGNRAKVRVRIKPPKKSDSLILDSLMSAKKGSDKTKKTKWSYFA